MEVILVADQPGLGYVGEKVKVRPGYARNYLLPRGVAVDANSASARQLKHIFDGINAKKARLKAEAEELKNKLEALNINFTLKLGEQGKSFGSVTSNDVENFLKNEGFEIHRKQIRLAEAIKSGGSFQVSVKLHSEVSANLTVNVKFDIPETKAVPQGEKKERGRGRKSKEDAEESETSES